MEYFFMISLNMKLISISRKSVGIEPVFVIDERRKCHLPLGCPEDGNSRGSSNKVCIDNAQCALSQKGNGNSVQCAGCRWPKVKLLEK